MTHRIGITLGDVTGVGPEVTLKAIAAQAPTDEARYLLIGDAGYARRLNTALALNLPLAEFTTWDAHGRFFLLNSLPEPLPERLPVGDAVAAHAAVAALQSGAERCLHGELDALVTAPVNKAGIIRAGYKFVGQTEFLSAIAKTDRTAMMLLGQDPRGRWLRVALVTIHVPLRRVAELITPERITLALELATRSCRELGRPRARVGVCGLNPHAGESGEIGDEELNIITPTIRAAQQRGLDVIGPLSGDTVFHHALGGEFDAVVAMYHDQGLAPLKAVAFDTGVNWTLGLPFIRTSPDHGTAYDIAGRGIANPSSMIAALRLAKQLAAKKPVVRSP